MTKDPLDVIFRMLLTSGDLSFNVYVWFKMVGKFEFNWLVWVSIPKLLRSNSWVRVRHKSPPE